MTSRPRRRRLLAAGAVLGVALPLLLAGWSAEAGIGLPSSGAAAASGRSDATPCPIIIVGTPDPSCPILGSSSPAATPTPSSSSGGTPPPSSGSSSGGGAGGTGGGGGSSSAAVAPGSSAAGAAATATAAAGGPNINPPALLGLLTVLNAPANVGVEQPLLHHFNLGGATLAATSLATPGPGSPGRPGGTGANAGLALAVLCVLGAGGAAVLAGRRFPVVSGRRRLVAAIPTGAAAAVALLMLGAHATPAVTVAIAKPAAAQAAPLAQHHVDAVDAPVFEQLTAIETRITSVAQRLTLVAASVKSDGEMHPSLGDAREATRQRLAEQLAGNLAAQYASEVQSEYAFFTTVVANPTQRTQLLTAAAAAPPAINQAVTYNVSAVQAMLQQEAAIAAAQAAVQTVRGPAPTSLLAPEQGAITQPFGPTQFTIEPPLTFDGVTYPHFHTGVDIANVLDTPVHAAADGVVVIAGSSVDNKGQLIGYGNYIVIQHAGHMITLYAHLDHMLVKPGQVVKAGDVIGLEGSTGYSTGPHLHFEVRINGLLANPLTYIGKQLA